MWCWSSSGDGPCSVPWAKTAIAVRGRRMGPISGGSARHLFPAPTRWWLRVRLRSLVKGRRFRCLKSTAEVIENWFRSHPLFGANTQSIPAAETSTSVADEIAKLGQLRSQGLLTEAEFEAQKARLLG